MASLPSSPSLRVQRCAHAALRVDAGALLGECVDCAEVLRGGDLVRALMENNRRLTAEVSEAKSVVYEMTRRAMDE